MPTEDKRAARCARTQRILAELEREITAAVNEGREPDSGKILSTLKWEIAARADSVEAMEDLVAGALVVLQEVSGRQSGAIASLTRMADDVASIRAEVAGLAALVRNAESSRADYARERNEADHRRDANLDLLMSEVRALAGSVGELYEMQGRLMVELAHRAKQDSIHEDEITGVRAALVKADAKADTALSTAVRAQAKQVGIKAAGWAFGLALFEALRWLMAATGKG